MVPWVLPQLDSDFAAQGVWTPGEFFEVQGVDYDGHLQWKAVGFVRA